MKKRTLQVQKLTLALGIDKFLFDCKARKLSPRTIEHYASTLKKFIAFTGDLPLKTITKDDVSAFLISGSEAGLSDSSLDGQVRDLRAFFNYNSHKINLKNIKVQEKVIIPFTKEQIKLLLKQPDKNTYSGLRDYTLISLLLDTGARISEALGICKQDILIDSGQIFIKGKGKKERFIPLGESCHKILKEYLRAVDDIPLDKPIFRSVYDNPLNRQTFNQRIQAYAQKAKITGVRASCHTFRHTFAKMYILNGGDQFTLQAILGHETMEMVRRYVDMFSGDIKEQHRKYSPLDSLVNKKRRL